MENNGQENRDNKGREQSAVPSAQGPAEFLNLKIREPHHKAAGAEAVAVALRHVMTEAGPVRGMKALNHLNKFGGVDCPGCAWPDPDDHRSVLGEYCENGAKAIAEEATTRLTDPEFFQRHDVTALSQLSDYEIGKSGRIAMPMILEPGSRHYQPISWQHVFSRIARFLRERTTPERSVFYTSGRTSNEAAFLYQLMVRQYGTNNLPDCSNMCHESSGVALKQTLGLGKGSVTLQDFEKARLILVVGQNPGTNHPRMLTALQKAKQAGAKIISINPLPEAGLMAFSNPQKPHQLLGASTALSDLHLPVRINGDVPLFKAMLLHILRMEEERPGHVLNTRFIEEYTCGFDALQGHLMSQDFGALVAASGVPEPLVIRAAELIASTDRFISCWAMGLTQHRNAVDNIREIVNLHLLKGAIGIPGAGTCPVRGHSNVQGDRTMGIHERPSPALLDSIEREFHFSPPREHGYDTVEAIRAMNDGRVDFFMAMGGNFLSAAPDTEVTAAGLRRCGMTVHVATKLNRTHLVHGETSILLPCLGRTDIDLHNGQPRFVTVENSMGIVHSSQGNLKPPSSHLLSEPDIVVGIATALFGEDSAVPWHSVAGDYGRIREWISATIPGFEKFNERIGDPAGFYLPNGPRHRQFTTEEGRAVFTINDWQPWELAEGQYLMMTIRSHDQFNTTIYGLNDRYRGVYFERRVVFMSHGDANSRGFRRGQVVHLRSCSSGRTREVRNFKVVPYDIPRGCVATYFPECNPLVPLESFARGSNTPTSKSVVVELVADSAEGDSNG
jgi:molybdopterin-dependent oxidoreductase alpha subunit